jgi:hypothetical protein
MSNTDDLELERQELNLLIQKGVKFDINIKIRERIKGIKGLFGKKKIIEKNIIYEIYEPTLSVLDRISEIALDMIINEEDFKNENDILTKARQLTRENAKRLARMVAIAVLGEDYHILELSKSNRTVRHNNDKELNRLTDVFFHSLTPSKLIGLASIITNTSNLSDFINSMRLLSGARTTQPIKDRME